MRICFQGPGPSDYRPATPVPYSTGTPPAASTTISELKRSFTVTGNKGNLIHAEAPAKLLKKNEARSCIVNLAHLQNSLKADYSRRMGEFFDAVVISMANFIRPKQDHSRLVEAVSAIPERVKIVVLGGGIQDKVRPVDLHPSTMDLIRVFNERCTVFGVRGEETSAWLKRQGFHNHAVLGCPSLFVYPLSVAKMSYEKLASIQAPRTISAGHLSRATLFERNERKRGNILVNAFQGVAADYLFQDEIFTFTELLNKPGVYNDATGEFDDKVILDYLNSISGVKIPFSKFFYFNDAAAWRQMYFRYDVYIGDRFHGGICALQSGLPALMLQHDKRVAELVNFFNIPAITIKEFADSGLTKAISQNLTPAALSKFKKTYFERIENFASVMENAGFEISNRAELPRIQEQAV